jgi:hypothetical protein
MATYTKLKSGEWGIRSTSTLVEGQQVIVTKKSGQAKTETVAKVIWRGNGVTLATIVASQAPASASYNRSDRAPHGRTCPQCGSRDCSKAWNSSDLCDED